MTEMTASGLERSYRRLLGLYPRDFRHRRGDEMVDMLMASAAPGQRRPGFLDTADIAKGALIVRLYGSAAAMRSWRDALAAFSLIGPLLLILADVLQIAIPYRNNALAMATDRSGRVDPVILHYWQGMPEDGGLMLLHRPDFLILAVGHLVVAMLAVAGLRRAALTALVAAASADVVIWTRLPEEPIMLTASVFILTACALAFGPGPAAARRLVTWRHAVVFAVLAAAAQSWAFAWDGAGNWWIFHYGLTPTGYLGLGAFLLAGAFVLASAFRLGRPMATLLLAAALPFVTQTALSYFPIGMPGVEFQTMPLYMSSPYRMWQYLIVFAIGLWAVVRAVGPDWRIRSRSAT